MRDTVVQIKKEGEKRRMQPRLTTVLRLIEAYFLMFVEFVAEQVKNRGKKW